MSKKLAVIDAETDPFLFGRVPLPFVWGFYCEDDYKTFYKTSELIEFLKEFDGIVFAHNGGKFDFHFLLEALEPNQKILIINGRLAKLKIGKAELRDSWLLFPIPLAAYKKDDFDYKLMEKGEREKHMPEIERYLYNDCKYLYELIKAQVDDYGLKISLPASAFNFWFKNFTDMDTIPKTSPKFFNFFRPFYYGGRVECFKKGVFNHEFKSYDINSAYPHAMQSEHPFGTRYIRRSKVADDPSAVFRSFIHFTGRSQGGLPVRDKNGLSFPNDNVSRNFYVSGWEFNEALKDGHLQIEKIHDVYEFEETINFTDYVNHFFKQKQEYKNVDHARYLLAKLYLNSLYGKFAMDGSQHEDITTCLPGEILDRCNNGFHFSGELGNLGLIGKFITEDKQTFYNIATAASITGFVRAYMFKHIKKAKGVMYCDTDSITCEDLPCKMGKELGNWECEGEYSRGAIAGKKMYAYQYKPEFRKAHRIDKQFKIASKGVKFSEKEIFLVAKGEKIIYKKEAPTFSIKNPVNWQDVLTGKKNVQNDKRFITREIKLT